MTGLGFLCLSKRRCWGGGEAFFFTTFPFFLLPFFTTVAHSLSVLSAVGPQADPLAVVVGLPVHASAGLGDCVMGRLTGVPLFTSAGCSSSLEGGTSSGEIVESCSSGASGTGRQG